MLYSQFFDKNLPVFEVIKIPNSLAKFDVPSLHVLNAFTQNDINVTDASHGIISFKRNCDLGGKKEQLIKKLKALYSEKYPCIRIKNIQVEARNTLRGDFRSFKLISVGLNDSKLRDNAGTFWAIFQTDTKRKKKIYFSYTIEASVLAFKAKHNMHNDKILSNSDYKEEMLVINNLPSGIITCDKPDNLISKSYINKDELLNFHKLEIKKDLLRGMHIRAYIIEGPLVISVNSQLLEDGNIGDKVRIKTEKNKFFYARIISKREAMIIQ